MTLEYLIKLLKDLIHSRFYGRVELIFEAGRITTCKKTETIKEQ